MQTIQVQTRRIFDVRHQKGKFSIFLSKQPNQLFVATFLYHDRSKLGNPNNQDWGKMDFQHRVFSGASEEEALNATKNWINQNLGDNYSLTEVTAEEADWEKRYAEFMEMAEFFQQ